MFDMPHFWMTVGVIGDIIVLGVYLLLQAGKLSSEGYPYLIWNVIGSSGIILGFIAEWRLADFLVESAWLVISLGAIVNLLWEKYQARQPKTATVITHLACQETPSKKVVSVQQSLSA